ncbi:MAG: diphosphate--fructose-6-phosphate 1-phosphotransferase [Chloroflexi bacterium]|nr:diphosphate--fructose-6-phosphate 1-phosphotransferase [Chloroflexota bacterium]
MAPTSNLLVLQSGGPTAVINRSLAGIVEEALRRKAFASILGAVHGMEGLLAGNIIDLGHQPASVWSGVARSPGAALGSARRKLKPDDMDEALAVLRRFNIRCVAGLGGNDTAENSLHLAKAAQQAGLDLAVVGVPKTVDNDLPAMDHTPGYGSAARFLAIATMGVGRDAEALGKAAPVTVLEVMGRNSGWLAAATALGKRDERDAPHVIGIPEQPIDEDSFITAVDNAVSRFGYAVAVVVENVRGPKGPLGQHGKPQYVDEFGHPYYASTGEYLARRLAKHLKARVRFEKPGTIQRSFLACVSRTDATEGFEAGRAAARLAARGESGVMVTLERQSDKPYRCSMGTTPLEAVAAKERILPSEYLDAKSGLPTAAFARYALPLLGAPLPRLERFRPLKPSL